MHALFRLGRALHEFVGERQKLNGNVKRGLAKDNSEGAGRALKSRGGERRKGGKKGLTFCLFTVVVMSHLLSQGHRTGLEIRGD